MIVRILIGLLLLTIPMMLLGQANAGDDKITCMGQGVMIGTAGAGNKCYSWMPTAGLDDPTSPTPMAMPNATTTYTLTVYEENFTGKSTDQVQVTVLPAADCCMANAVVMPTSMPNITNPGPNNTVTPAFPTLNWEACFDPNDQLWHVRVTSLVCTGQINIRPWPSQPAMMVVPNTANPVMGGNINNVIGSNNRWAYAISDMQNYDTAGGGAGPHWHSTAASTAHENFHWNTDWMVTCIGANWGGAETAIEMPSTMANTKAAATANLTPMVMAAQTNFNNQLLNIWNNTIGPADTPGGGGGGYAAGTAVLAGLIAAVEAYRIANGW